MLTKLSFAEARDEDGVLVGLQYVVPINVGCVYDVEAGLGRMGRKCGEEEEKEWLYEGTLPPLSCHFQNRL